MSNTTSQPDVVRTAASSAGSDKLAAKHRRRPPLLVGLVMIAVVAAGYFGWQQFTHSPRLPPAPPPPVPVIAATVQQSNFPIVLTGIGNVTALNTATVRSQVTGHDRQMSLQGRTVRQEGRALGPDSIRAPIRRSSTRRKPISPATRPISKTDKSTSAAMFRCKSEDLRRSSRSPPSRR